MRRAACAGGLTGGARPLAETSASRRADGGRFVVVRASTSTYSAGRRRRRSKSVRLIEETTGGRL